MRELYVQTRRALDVSDNISGILDNSFGILDIFFGILDNISGILDNILGILYIFFGILDNISDNIYDIISDYVTDYISDYICLWTNYTKYKFLFSSEYIIQYYIFQSVLIILVIISVFRGNSHIIT